MGWGNVFAIARYTHRPPVKPSLSWLEVIGRNGNVNGKLVAGFQLARNDNDNNNIDHLATGFADKGKRHERRGFRRATAREKRVS